MTLLEQIEQLRSIKYPGLDEVRTSEIPALFSRVIEQREYIELSKQAIQMLDVLRASPQGLITKIWRQQCESKGISKDAFYQRLWTVEGRFAEQDEYGRWRVRSDAKEQLMRPAELIQFKNGSR